MVGVFLFMYIIPKLKEEAIHAARDFIVLLRDHILKEDKIFFPYGCKPAS